MWHGRIYRGLGEHDLPENLDRRRQKNGKKEGKKEKRQKRKVGGGTQHATENGFVGIDSYSITSLNSAF